MAYTRLQVTDHVDKWDAAKITHLEDGIVGSVHTTTQSLTEAQKETARKNIGINIKQQLNWNSSEIPSSNAVAEYVDQQTASLADIGEIYQTFDWDGNLFNKKRILITRDSDFCVELVKISSTPISFFNAHNTIMGSNYAVLLSGLEGISDAMKTGSISSLAPGVQVVTCPDVDFPVFVSAFESISLEGFALERGVWALVMSMSYDDNGTYYYLPVLYAKAFVQAGVNNRPNIVNWNNIDFTQEHNAFTCEGDTIIIQHDKAQQSLTLNSIEYNKISTDVDKFATYSYMSGIEIIFFGDDGNPVTGITASALARGVYKMGNAILLAYSNTYINDTFIPAGVYVNKEIKKIQIKGFPNLKSFFFPQIPHENYDCIGYTEEGYEIERIPVTNCTMTFNGDFWIVENLPYVPLDLNTTYKFTYGTKEYVYKPVMYDGQGVIIGELDKTFVYIAQPTTSTGTLLCFDFTDATNAEILFGMKEYREEIIHQIDEKYLPENLILPKVTTADNGKVLQVVNGQWALVDLSS